MLSGGLREGRSLETGFATEAGLVFVFILLFLHFVGEESGIGTCSQNDFADRLADRNHFLQTMSQAARLISS